MLKIENKTSTILDKEKKDHRKPSSRYQSVWSIISKYKLNVDPRSTDGDWMCILCKSLLIDAVVSNVCGCQYCYKCICEHSNNGNKFCPGNDEDCKKEVLVFDKNAFRSVMVNKKVSNLKVTCPNQSCKYVIKLSTLEEHIRTCRCEPIKCPYSLIGCNGKQGNKDAISTHLHDEALCHADLLIEWIKNMKNEITMLKSDSEKSKLQTVSVEQKMSAAISTIEDKVNRQIKKMTEELLERSHGIQNVKSEMADLKRDHGVEFAKHRLAIASLKVDLTTLRNDLEKKVNNETEIIKNKIGKHSEEIDSLSTIVHKPKKAPKVDFSESKSEIALLKAEFIKMLNDLQMKLNKETEAIKIEVSKQKRETTALTTALYDLMNDTSDDFDDIKLKIATLKEDSRNKEMGIITLREDLVNVANGNKTKISLVSDSHYEDVRSVAVVGTMTDETGHFDGDISREITVKELCPNVEADYVWRISDYSEKLDTRIYSEAFYVNNYKMSLFIYTAPCSNYVVLYCYIMNGENDDKLLWPMRRAVTLNIINQNTLMAFKSLTHRGVFYRPKKDLGNNAGGWLTTYYAIKNNASVLVNDSIVVSCVLGDL